MNLSAKTITLILGSLLASSIAYNIKQYKELNNHHREIAQSTMNILTACDTAFDEIEKNVPAKDKDGLIQAHTSLACSVFSIGAGSIAEIYDELSDNQKEIVWKVRLSFLDLASNENE